MPKLRTINNLCILSFRSLPAAFVCALNLTLSLAFGQASDQSGQSSSEISKKSAAFEVLPPRLGANWRAIGPARVLDSEKFAIVQDADLYLEYGLKRLTTRAYTDGKTKVIVEAFEMLYPSGAYGLFSFNRSSLSPNRKEFHIGRYLVSISSQNSTPFWEKLSYPDLISALQYHFSEGPVRLPTLPLHLPEENKIADSEKYLIGPAALSRLTDFSDLKDLVDFSAGTEIATANYNNNGGRMSLIIIEYHTPQLASAGYARIKSHLEMLDPEEKQNRLIKRIGNYVVEAVGIKDAVAAQELISQIKYTAKVYWEGDRFSAIPLPFRPPDELAIEELRRTTRFLTEVFLSIAVIAIGVIIVGVFAGGSIFYWRRWRRHKLGLDKYFSDAGGTIRLNLDDYLLPPGDSKTKLLGKSD